MNANVRTIGGAIGSQIVASIIAGTIVGSALPKEHGYELSFIVLGVALALAGVAAAFVPSRANRASRRPTGHEFDTLAVDPASIAPAEAGLAIGEHAPLSGQRVDAARNRKRVLEAAVDEHARHGAALGMQDVARRAGVGHRHGLPALPVAPGADRGDRPPVLRARPRARALGAGRGRRGGSLRRATRAASRGCWPTTAWTATACGTHRPPSPCAPSCGR